MAIIDFESECWGDPWFQNRSPLGKLLFIYLWTNNHRNLSGLYIITKKTMLNETCIKSNQLDLLLKELEPKVIYDPEKSVCFVLKHVRRQFLRGTANLSDRLRIGIRKAALKLNYHPFFESFVQQYPEIFDLEELKTFYKPDLYPIDTVSIGSKYPMDTSGGEGKGNSLKERGGVGEKTRFELFWKAYPKKKSKGQAEKAWTKIKPDEQLLERMLSIIERAKKSDEWKKSGPIGIPGEFIPYPATWLNAKGWEDEFEGKEQKNEPARFRCKWCGKIYMINEDHQCPGPNVA